jgi:hypothetical protein
MAKAEQENLLRLGRLNREGAIAEAKQRTADAAADFEMRLAAAFSYDQRETWVALMSAAKSQVAAFDNELAEDCRRLGIPERFRPSINLYWLGRGENASKERRSELRRVAHARLVALERTAIAAIEAGYRRYASAVLSASLDSGEARTLLTTLPTVKELLPATNYEQIKRALPEGPEAASLQVGLSIADETGADNPL